MRPLAQTVVGDVVVCTRPTIVGGGGDGVARIGMGERGKVLEARYNGRRLVAFGQYHALLWPHDAYAFAGVDHGA